MRHLGGMLLPVAGLALACSVEEPTGPTGSGQSTAEQWPAGTTTAALTTTTFIDQAGNVGWYTSLASGARWPAAHHLPGPHQPRPEVCHVRQRLRLGEQLDQGLHRPGRERGPAQLARGRLQRPAACRLSRRDQPGSQIRRPARRPRTAALAASWTKARVDTQDDAGVGSAIALGADGRRHVSHLRRRMGPAGATMALRYATCSSGCGQAANWTKVTVDEGPDLTVAPDYFLGTSIAIGRDGRRHISYFNAAGSDLRYATCLLGLRPGRQLGEGDGRRGVGTDGLQQLARGRAGWSDSHQLLRSRERRPHVRPLRVRLHQAV